MESVNDDREASLPISNIDSRKTVHPRSCGRGSLPVLVVKAYLELIRSNRGLKRNNCATFYQKIRSTPTAHRAGATTLIAKVCHAVDLACIWYWKEVLCLQRSAVTTCLLRRNGIAAQMVIGVQHLPFQAHAWVEVDGTVVNDRSYVREIYSVLDLV
jgi:hypothetical protein